MTIKGVKTLDVRIDKRAYAEAMILKDAGLDFAVIEPASKFVANDDMTKPVYSNNVFTLQNDGSYAKPKSVDVGNSAVSTADITPKSSIVDYNSNYGAYVLSVAFDGFAQEDFNSELYFNNYLMNLYGAVIRDSSGNTAGALYYEDMWVEVKNFGEIQVAFSNGDLDIEGNNFINTRFNKFFDGNIFLPGVYSITFMSRGFGDISVDFEIKEKIFSENSISIQDASYTNEVKLPVDISQLKSDYMMLLTNTKLFKNNKPVDAEKYSFDPETKMLTVKSGIGAYKFMLVNSRYESVTCPFNVLSKIENRDLFIKDGKLTIADGKDSSIADYIDGITSISIDKNEGLSPVTIDNTRNIMFENDGVINYDVKDIEGNLVLKDVGKYTLTVKSNGYKDFVFEIVKE